MSTTTDNPFKSFSAVHTWSDAWEGQHPDGERRLFPSKADAERFSRGEEPERFGRGLPLEPVVGMGVTICVNTDRYPATIERVNDAGTRIWVRRDQMVRTEDGRRPAPNPDGRLIEVSRRKGGKWLPKGCKATDWWRTVRIGRRDHDLDRALFASVRREDLEPFIADARERGERYRVVTRTVSVLGTTFEIYILVVRP